MTVSVILSTRNVEKTLEKCLLSLQEAAVKPLEIIVVDRDSTDKTVEIAKKYTSKVFNHGPERSAQRNFGARLAKGDYLFFIDSDMELSRDVIKEALELVSRNTQVRAVSIPEKSFGEGFWSEIKAFERSFYVGETDLEAPRFIEKSVFEKVGGFDEKLIAGEDWDLTNRIKKDGYKIERIKSLILHNEGRLSLLKTAKKKYYYGSQIKNYLAKGQFTISQVTPLRVAFFKNPGKLIKNPLKTAGLVVLKSTEFSAGALGLIGSLISRQKS